MPGGVDIQMPNLAETYLRAMDFAMRRDQMNRERDREKSQIAELGLRKQAVSQYLAGRPDALVANFPELHQQMESQRLAGEKQKLDIEAAAAAKPKTPEEMRAIRTANRQRLLMSAPEDVRRLEKARQDTMSGALNRFEVPGPNTTAAGYERMREQVRSAPAQAVSGDAAKGAIDLRKEFQGMQEFKDARVVQGAYHNVRAASSSAAGDIALMFGYMKLLDPNSGVKEGETAMLDEAQGIPDRVKALYRKAVSGNSLGDQVRREIKREARLAYEAKRADIERTADEYRRIAEQSGYDPDDIVLGLWDDDEPGVPAAPIPVRKPAPQAGATSEFRRRLEADKNKLPPEVYRAKLAELDAMEGK